MNRSYYYMQVSNKLSILKSNIEVNGKLNILNDHVFSETFYAELLNLIYGYELNNLNKLKQNVAGIDLIDHKNKIFIQVSADSTKSKIEKSLSKDILLKFTDYTFKFVAISKDATNLRNNKFINNNNIKFDPKRDIIDVAFLLKEFSNIKDILKQKEIVAFLKNELDFETNSKVFDTNLASIINILYNESLEDSSIPEPNINQFEIDRKIKFNNLIDIEEDINDYLIYFGKLNEKYAVFDKEGANRSFSILRKLNKIYRECSKRIEDSLQIYSTVYNEISDIIIKSKNYVELPLEELELYINIILTDAFIKCKIFKNPENYNAFTR